MLLSVTATALIMRPLIVRAKQEAYDAKAQVAALTQGTDPTKDATRGARGESGDGVDDPWVASGTFTTGDATLDEEVKAFCDGICTTDQGRDEAAFAVYTAVALSESVERDDAQDPSGAQWRIDYARKYYEHDCSGNCYEFSAFIMYCLRYLGYDDALAEGVILEYQSGDWGDHCLVFVTNEDGESCLCDTSLGVDGWMLSSGVYNYEVQDFEGTRA